jgi:hypothetical protein
MRLYKVGANNGEDRACNCRNGPFLIVSNAQIQILVKKKKNLIELPDKTEKTTEKRAKRKMQPLVGSVSKKSRRDVAAIQNSVKIQDFLKKIKCDVPMSVY